ncbi:hypothetical protein DK254_00360 [Pseudomonas sp. RW407]|uniref:phage tail assembly chaperone family protein, TAC n=1 Tax=Pseudomonas sp. RW407 TaxID=2202894 RepID=UPI000D6F5DE9|nr:phage tail assembly chaperone family protein, TAC [Pseudomonas sp. RW407]PWU30737.1 hypothetical protein DK254_11780 [Pseudomonas sp. RW407]PWU32170.1 hypothetical protein DK254_00360 [Pseudomonas sp. RW407]
MTDFSLDLIQSTGAAIGAPVEKEITWVVGGKEHKATVFVRLSSYDRAMREFELQKESNDVLVARIVSSIVDRSGKPVFTSQEQITGDPETGEGKMIDTLFFALLGAINSANGYQAEPAKN